MNKCEICGYGEQEWLCKETGKYVCNDCKILENTNGMGEFTNDYSFISIREVFDND